MESRRSFRSLFAGPRSLVGLMLMGYVVVALPLTVAVVRAVIHADRLEAQSQALVEQGVKFARTGESLASQVSDMERNARQFQVVGDPALRRVYGQRHERFLQTLDGLSALPVADATNERIHALRDASRNIAAAVAEFPPQSNDLARAMDQFEPLGNLTAELNDRGVAYLDQQLAELQQSAADTRRMLALQSALAIPAALLLALAFTVLINRPVRQLQLAIRRLGRGDFDRRVRVDGPPELKSVGERLDWLRQRLAALEEEKSRFLRHMSHELKTPLASLREGSDLLLDGSIGPLDETQRDVAELLRANSVELQQMILNLLDFSAWQERTTQLQLADVAFGALARAVVDRHRLAIQGRSLRVTVAGNGIEFTGDRDKLRTAMDNLVSNAIKYSPEGGGISIVARRDASRIVIDIEDDGPGIPAAERERVFEPFYRGPTPHAGTIKGTGIGLSVVKECINAHGGHIEILDSQAGAHVRIVLPETGPVA